MNTTSWKIEPLGRLLDHIVGTYHESLRREIPDLIDLAGEVEKAHADHPRAPRGLSDHLRFMHAAVLSHLEKEEQALFPTIRAGLGATAAGPIRVMELEHEDHGQALARIHELTGDLTTPEGAGPAWRTLCRRLAELEAELREHIELENNVLFPRALQES
jgi:regulator of cell morphogenesis and NO signaling